jgi:hypothetical protein
MRFNSAVLGVALYAAFLFSCAPLAPPNISAVIAEGGHTGIVTQAGTSSVAAFFFAGDTNSNTGLQMMLSFNLPSISASGLVSAKIRVYYIACNGQPFSDLGSLLYEHIVPDYRPITGDEYADPSTLTATGTLIAGLPAGTTWIEKDVTVQVRSDLAAAKGCSQFRFYFPVVTDNDNAWDYPNFKNAVNSDVEKPELVLEYR